MGAAFLIGLAVVCFAAFVLALLPPSKVGGAAILIRYAAAGFLIAMGALLTARGVYPGLVLIAAGVFVLMRRRLPVRMGQPNAPPATGGRMSIEEAYQVLGLQVGVTEDEIRRAHRELMQKIHPDHGGSDYLATKLNQARDTLLNRSR